MVRKCIIPKCESTDMNILSHRFPRNQKLTQKWQDALNIENTSLSELFLKYVVCTKHFKRSDYRNPISHHLNSTAIPCLDIEEEETEYQIVELLDEVEEDCAPEEEEEHLEYPSVADENCDNVSYANYIFPYESNIESSERETMDIEEDEEELQEHNEQQYETIEMNLTDDNAEKTNMIEEEEPIIQQEYEIVKEPPSRKRKIEPEPEQPEVTPEPKLKVTTEEIPEIESKTKKEEKPVEKKTTVTEEGEIEISDDEDSNFKKLSRNELIKKIKNQSKKIADLEKKVKSYQKKMTVSMKTIKQLMLGNSDDDDDDI